MKTTIVLAAIVLANIPSLGVAQIYSTTQDLRSSFTLDGTRQMISFMLSVQSEHCASRSPDLKSRIDGSVRRLDQLTPRIAALLVLNRNRARSEINDVPAFYDRLEKEQASLVARQRAVYYKGGSVKDEACAAETLRMASILDDLEEMVPSIEEDSRR